MHLRNLWFRYGRRSSPWILRNVDLTLRAGEVAVLHGSNGAGKSTLLRLAAGVLRPTRGAVLDRPAVVGWVPERFPADQAFSARTYLTHVARIQRQRNLDEIERWARLLGCEHYLHARLVDLSKGNAQKIGLIQAMLTRPELLVLDEPWERLDVLTRGAVPAIIKTVTDSGGRVLVSDHRGRAAGLPGATVWHLDRGSLTARLTLSPTGALDDRSVIEVAVPTVLASALTARLHADGLEVLRVRAETHL